MALLDATPGRPLINYNYTDFAEGTGIKIFYAAHSKEDTTDNYLLTGSVLYSNDIETTAGYGSDPATKVIDKDFDLTPFNLPKNIKGTAYISVPFLVVVATGNGEGYVIAKLRKVDLGSNEIEIASAQSENTGDVAGANWLKKQLLKMTVPLTHFKKGETLRLTIECWGRKWGGGAGGVITIAHDPKERTTTKFGGAGTYKVTTSLKAHIPFRLGV